MRQAQIAAALFALLLIAMVAGSMAFVSSVDPRRAMLLPAVPVLALLLFACALTLERAVRAPLPWLAFTLGLAFGLGGPAFDIAITLAHTPDLSLEANPLVVLLLERGHSLALVYAYAAVGQLFVAAITTALWAAYLRQRGARRRIAAAASFVRYLAYSVSWFWLLALPFVGANVLYRYYLGLSWLELVPYVEDHMFQSVAFVVLLPVGIVTAMAEHRAGRS